MDFLSLGLNLLIFYEVKIFEEIVVNSWRKSHVTQTKSPTLLLRSHHFASHLSHTCPTLASSAVICPHERELLDEPQDTHL